MLNIFLNTDDLNRLFEWIQHLPCQLTNVFMTSDN